MSWLNDPEFLPRHIPHARVLVWGYNASFSSFVGDTPSQDRIHHHAHTLIANLAADRRVGTSSPSFPHLGYPFTPEADVR